MKEIRYSIAFRDNGISKSPYPCTPCEIKPGNIGSDYCQSCEHFHSINIRRQMVYCKYQSSVSIEVREEYNKLGSILESGSKRMSSISIEGIRDILVEQDIIIAGYKKYGVSKDESIMGLRITFNKLKALLGI